MRSVLLAAAVIGAAAPVAVYAQAAPKFSTSTSTINQLLADPAAKAVLVKAMPPIEGAAAQVGDQTLKGLQALAPDQITDKMLADLDAELAKIK